MEAVVYNIKGEECGKVVLPENVFERTINVPLMHEAVVWYNANKRQGTHAAKTRAEVSGSGKKPWKQKGTGRARAGSIRSPLWRHGGVIFAKKPRDFSFIFPKKKKRLALLSSLSAKAKDGAITVLEDLTMEEPKTRQAAEIVKNLSAAMKIHTARILLVAARNQTINLAVRNLSGFRLRDIEELNTYEVLEADKIIFTKQMLDKAKEFFV